MEGRTMSNCIGTKRMENQRTEGWPECFQDLASWCPPPQDELNTPKTLQDEFNFSVGQGRGCTWDASSPVGLESDLWESQDLLQSPSLTIDEENIMDSHCTLPADKPQQIDKKLSYNLIKESPIKPNGNVLLSQGGFASTVVTEQKDVDLFSLFKSEEPFILNTVKATKLNSSFASPANCETIDLERKLTVSVKVEKPYCTEEQYYVLNNMQGNEVERKDKPKLKLNIAAANSASSKYPFASVDTPDVVKSLTDESTGFDLLSFVNGDFDDPNLLITDLTNVGATTLASSRADPVIIKSDHDYTETRAGIVEYPETDFEVKSEPLSPHKKEEDRKQPGKRRSTVSSDDYVYESDSNSDESLDWSPTTNYKKRGKTGKKKGQKIKGVKRTRKLSVDSDADSIISGSDRYRELRDRNNEASRKSRLNRKQKEVEMIQLAVELEQENADLKTKADSLEKLVKKLREALMNIVLTKK